MTFYTLNTGLRGRACDRMTLITFPLYVSVLILDASLWSSLGRADDVLAWNTLVLGRIRDLINLHKSFSITSHKAFPKHWWSSDGAFLHKLLQFITKHSFNSISFWDDSNTQFRLSNVNVVTKDTFTPGPRSEPCYCFTFDLVSCCSLAQKSAWYTYILLSSPSRTWRWLICCLYTIVNALLPLLKD